MYCYHLNKKKSQTFVEYYKEDNDKINIHYGDGSILETDNTESTKINLNNIQESQLNIERPKYKEIIDEKYFVLGAGRFISLLFFGVGSFFALLILPEAGTLGFLKFMGINCLIGLPYFAPNIINFGKYLLNAIPNKKFDLFMKYKYDLNSRVELIEEKVESKSINPVVKRKSSILNLSINDVHFMKYSELREITDAVDKVKLQENRINSFSSEKVKGLVKVKRNNKGGYKLC